MARFLSNNVPASVSYRIAGMMKVVQELMRPAKALHTMEIYNHVEWNEVGRAKPRSRYIIFQRAFRGSGMNGNTSQAVVRCLCLFCVLF